MISTALCAVFFRGILSHKGREFGVAMELKEIDCMSLLLKVFINLWRQAGGICLVQSSNSRETYFIEMVIMKAYFISNWF
jgi:hypothetical protein